MDKNTYKFPLSVQTVLPEDYRSNSEFQKDMQLLQEFGLSGVELNIAYPSRTDYDDLTDFLSGYNLKFSKFASGLTAKTFGLSLSSSDISIRNKAIEKLIEAMSVMSGKCEGIILGFFKGAPAENVEEARILMRDSIVKLAPYAKKHKVPLILEATNHYESSVANTLEDTFEIIKDFSESNEYIKMLPDTYHMNIEEADMFGKLNEYSNFYTDIHLSDNNRYFPGYGAIDFEKTINYLENIGFNGGFAIEGRLFKDFRTDIVKSVNYLQPLLKNE